MNDIKRYSVGGFLGDGVRSNVGQWVTFEDYEKRVNGQLRLLEVSGRYNEKLEARIAELELAMLYYADENNYINGDAPGHVYAVNDGGHAARKVLSLNQEQVELKITDYYASLFNEGAE